MSSPDNELIKLNESLTDYQQVQLDQLIGDPRHQIRITDIIVVSFLIYQSLINGRSQCSIC